MNIIYLVSRAKTTGPINQGLNILKGMKLNGRVNSTFVTLAPENPKYSWIQRYKDENIDIVQFNLPLWKSLLAIPKLRKLVKERNIDVIHSCGYRANFIALLSCTNAKIVITQRCHPSEAVEKFPKIVQPVFNAFYLWMIKRMNKVVACSKAIQNIMKYEYSMDVECVQNGVDTEIFKPVSKEEKELLRKELGLPQNKLVYLVLGSLRSRKNNKLIIDSVKQLDRSEGVIFVFVGDGPEKEMLVKEAEGINSIYFAGLTSTPIKYLQIADFLVSASLAEGLPNTVLEALSCGVPCILSDIEPHKELIGNTDAGIIFDRHSGADLCKKLIESASWDLSKKAKSARGIAISKFSIESLANKYEAIYCNLFK